MMRPILDVEVYDDSEEGNCCVFQGCLLDGCDELLCVEWAGDPCGFRSREKCIEHLAALCKRFEWTLRIRPEPKK